MEDKDVAGAVVFEVGDLQTIGVSCLLWLEGCIDGVDLDHCFGLFSLKKRWSKGNGDVCVLKTAEINNTK